MEVGYPSFLCMLTRRAFTKFFNSSGSIFSIMKDIAITWRILYEPLNGFVLLRIRGQHALVSSISNLKCFILDLNPNYKVNLKTTRRIVWIKFQVSGNYSSRCHAQRSAAIGKYVRLFVTVDTTLKVVNEKLGGDTDCRLLSLGKTLAQTGYHFWNAIQIIQWISINK
jgi:hypothetical protein